jgi:hypothetical protein
MKLLRYSVVLIATFICALIGMIAGAYLITMIPMMNPLIEIGFTVLILALTIACFTVSGFRISKKMVM